MQKLLLIGGGHAHLYVLSQLAKKPNFNVHVQLISSHRYFYYSGMVAGYVEGLYREDEIKIPLDVYCHKLGFDFLEAEVVSISPEQKYIETDTGKRIDYDVVSFNLGSLSRREELLKNIDHAWSIKPLHRMVSFLDDLEECQNLIIVGGGASTVELGMAIHHRMRKKGQKVDITIVSKQPIMHTQGGYVSASIIKEMKACGIKLWEYEEVVSVENRSLTTISGNHLSYDCLLWLTGPDANRIFAVSKLPVDEAGFLRVNTYLQVESYPEIFAAGDCVHIQNHENLPKAGVFAIRQAKVLTQNIHLFLSQQPLVNYHPQRKYVSIVSLGNRKGIWIRGKWVWKGRWAWRLKQLIDKRYMRKYAMKS